MGKRFGLPYGAWTSTCAGGVSARATLPAIASWWIARGSCAGFARIRLSSSSPLGITTSLLSATSSGPTASPSTAPICGLIKAIGRVFAWLSQGIASLTLICRCPPWASWARLPSSWGFDCCKRFQAASWLKESCSSAQESIAFVAWFFPSST